MINFLIPSSLDFTTIPEKHSIYVSIKGIAFELYMHRCAIMGFTDDEYEWCCTIYKPDTPSLSTPFSWNVESLFINFVSGGEYIKDKEYADLRDESASYKTALTRAYLKAMCSTASIRSTYK